MVLGSNWVFVIYKVFKSSNPVMFISCTYGYLDLLLFLFILLYKHFSIATYHPKTYQTSFSVFGGKVTEPDFFHLCKVTQCFGNKISALEEKK